MQNLPSSEQKTSISLGDVDVTVPQCKASPGVATDTLHIRVLRPTCGWTVQSVMTTGCGRLEIMCICTATCPALVALADVNTLPHHRHDEWQHTGGASVATSKIGHAAGDWSASPALFTSKPAPS